MKISHLQVSNYRGLRDVSIPLSRFVCITGENNSGKSSVLQALSLFLSGSALKSSDYFDLANEVVIAVTFSDITQKDLELLVEEHRDRIAKLITNNKLTLVRRYRTDGKGELGYLGLVPKEPRFTAEHVAKLVAGKKGNELKDTVLATFPELDGKVTASTTQTAIKELVQELAENLPQADKEIRFVVLPTGLDKSVLPMLPERIYIPAVKDLSDDTKTAETSSFGKILAIVMKTIEPLLAEEQGLFEKLSRKLTRIIGTEGSVQDDRLDEIKNIEQKIQDYVRESFANVSLEIEIPPPELKSVLSTARIIADDGVKGPLELKGDGLRRAVVFSILRAYVEVARSAARVDVMDTVSERGYLMLFEEPELFLHPGAQKILFDALGVFSKQHHVVVTTHSPLFLGPDATATFVRLTKTKKVDISKPFTTACPVELTGISPRDEFQIICFENNNAAFFAKRIVLVEGDSDLIVFPHIAETLDAKWDCGLKSVVFVRVSGKGSIARYRSFFQRFDVPLFIITDLDTIEDGFEKLEPTDAAKILRSELLQKVDLANTAAGLSGIPQGDAIKSAQTSRKLPQLWAAVCAAKAAFDEDKNRYADLETAVNAFFAWEKKSIRRETIRIAHQADVKSVKLALIWELRKNGVFVLEKGALEDYFPAQINGPDKPSKAQVFRNAFTKREHLLPLSPQQTCPVTGKINSEFEFMFSAIFE